MRRLALVLLWLIVAAASAQAVTIDHNDVDRVASVPQSVLDQVAQQRWLFAHASVGENIIGGLTLLHGANPVRFPVVTYRSGDGTEILPPPPATTGGMIYDGSRGNPGWQVKFEMFDDAVRNLGWHYPRIDAAMDKLCFIDDSAEVAPYLASMSALERDFPDTRFVYVTRPLFSTGSYGSANIGAFAYNTAVREHCRTNNRFLFDLADIESHDPAGNPITFTVGDQTYERMYDGYTSDTGHLNSSGSVRMAMAWYALAAALVSQAADVPAPGSDAAARITSIVPNPFNPITAIRYRLATPGRAELAVFDVRGRLVARLLDGDLPEGEHETTWRGVDETGRSVAAGVYLVRLSTEEETSVQRAVLAR